MNAIFANRGIFFIAGPGGVGKTTLSAALGIALAKQSYKTIVLTVDPAKRLANALGLDEFSQEIQEIKLGGVSPLYASQLDSRTYFDRVIERFSKSSIQKDRILSNPMYRTMVETLGGTHEYAAMERLLEFVDQNQFEKIVVDTPPTQNAIDLLSAPQRLADFMDSSVLKWFQGPRPYYLTLFRQSTKLVMKFLHRIFGGEFLARFSELMDDLEGMQLGFRSRNLQVIELLRSPRTAFILATTASESRFTESRAFLATLKDQKIQPALALLNRLEPNLSELKENSPVAQYYRSLWQSEGIWVEKFDSIGLPIVRIERHVEPIENVESLFDVGKQIVGGW